MVRGLEDFGFNWPTGQFSTNFIAWSPQDPPLKSDRRVQVDYRVIFFKVLLVEHLARASQVTNQMVWRHDGIETLWSEVAGF